MMILKGRQLYTKDIILKKINDFSLSQKIGLVCVGRLKAIKNTMDSLIYLSTFNLLLKLLTSDSLVLPNSLYRTSSQDPLAISITGLSSRPRSSKPIHLDLLSLS